MTGLPSAGLFVNYLPTVRAGVPTSAARIFHRLGYRTRFFYGGYLSWQRIGDFAREQGFDEVYGGDQMSARLSGNEWGVDDAKMFDFILERTGVQPTFDVIMSTSYHPPFSVDLEAAGFDLEALRANPLCRGLSTQQLRALGHLWYSDKSLGDFVQQAEERLVRPLFAMTGDHYSREESVNPRPNLFESSAVPFVLYGRDALAGVRRPGTLAGSHVDIVPTLVDLVAPAGFAYHAFGRDLLDPTQAQVGYGNDTVIAPDFVLNVRQPDARRGSRGPASRPAPCPRPSWSGSTSSSTAWPGGAPRAAAPGPTSCELQPAFASAVLKPAVARLVDRDLVDDRLAQVLGEAGVIERHATRRAAAGPAASAATRDRPRRRAVRAAARSRARDAARRRRARAARCRASSRRRARGKCVRPFGRRHHVVAQVVAHAGHELVECAACRARRLHGSALDAASTGPGNQQVHAVDLALRPAPADRRAARPSCPGRCGSARPCRDSRPPTRTSRTLPRTSRAPGRPCVPDTDS